MDTKGEFVDHMEVQAAALDFMVSLYADKTCKTDDQGSFRVGSLRPGRYETRLDTEDGVNINTQISTRQITVKDGNYSVIGDLLFLINSLPQ